MKKILNIVNMETQADVEKIDERLQETRLKYEINLENKAVIVHGGSDERRVALLAIEEVGFEIL